MYFLLIYENHFLLNLIVYLSDRYAKLLVLNVI